MLNIFYTVRKCVKWAIMNRCSKEYGKVMYPVSLM